MTQPRPASAVVAAIILKIIHELLRPENAGVRQYLNCSAAHLAPADLALLDGWGAAGRRTGPMTLRSTL
jgi:hypothetical protein